MVLRGARWTLAQITTDVAARLDDATHTRWSQAQKELAIRSALRRARSKWWEERRSDQHTYADSTLRYALPPACEGVEKVCFVGLDDDDPEYFVVPKCWHIEGDELVFDRTFSKYDGQGLIIHYFVYAINLLTITGTGSFTGTSMSLSGGDFIANGVAVGDEVLVPTDAGSPYYVTEVLTSDTLTVDKDFVESSGTVYVAYYTDLPYEYLVYGALAELYEMVSRNRPGVEVKEAIQWATYYRQLSDQVIQESGRHMRSSRRY